VEGPDRLLYGSVYEGTAANEFGSVFRISPAGRFEPLHTFSNSDGANPAGPLLVDAEGTLYGVTVNGGAADGGVLFKLVPGGEPELLNDFGVTAGETGTHPRSRLVLGSDGLIYGTTTDGGEFDEGTVFSIATSGGPPEVLAAFGGASGQGPHDLLQAPNGTFFGRAFGGQGMVFELGASGIVSTLRALTGDEGDFDFNLGDGEAYGGALALGANGKLYGSAPRGGASGNGTLFELTLEGTFTPLVSLETVSAAKGVLLGNDGNLYFSHGSGVAKFLLPGATSTTLVCTPTTPAEEDPDADDGDGEVDPASEDDDDGEATAGSGGATAGTEPTASAGTGGTAATDDDDERDRGDDDDAKRGCSLAMSPASGLRMSGFALVALGWLAARRRARR
jgi:uncharacterized repeat protein (TIGR03803 family)